MGYMKPVPVEKEKIRIGEKYFTCTYTGAFMVTVVKIFKETDSVLVKVKSAKCKPFVRSMKYLFDNQEMAKTAKRNWEHDERKRKR